MLLLGDCRDSMAFCLGENEVDAIVTDPPYELAFMGKKWDSTGVAFDAATWRECLRVLKPGGHLLAFGGTRTYHRMVCAIEDAGFEIRDQIGWAFGSGFPKSMDVSKAIDKAAGAERACTREGTVQRDGFGGRDTGDSSNRPRYDRPVTDAARQWQGWGTALKPAWEPIVVARKPLIGTVATNVLTHGTGALNIDGCRVPGAKPDTTRGAGGQHGRFSELPAQGRIVDDGLGRWPANLIHDGSDEVVALFPREAGAAARVSGDEPSPASVGRVTGERARVEGAFHADSGSAARFFYCAKASRTDRNEGADNSHPTVKPTALMRYLCRLVTPPGGTVLDPFMGSGSTGRGAVLEGFRFIGCELSPEYLAVAQARIAAAAAKGPST